MLYTVIATPRSGSSSLCGLVSAQYNAKNLGEVFFPFYGRRKKDCVYKDKILKLIEASKKKDIVVKILVNKTDYMSQDTIKLLLHNSQKLFYSIRLDHIAQVKSMLAGKQTRKFGKRKSINETITIKITGDDMESNGTKMLEYIRKQGQWYKEFPGELCILDHWGNEPYVSCYDFNITKSIKEFLNPMTVRYIDREFDILSIFHEGDINSSLIN
jgi:hypothetical protein